MAKKKTPNERPAHHFPLIDEAVAMRPEANVPLISKTKLNKLLDADNNCKEEIAEVVAGLRGNVATAVEKDHLHKPAYADVKRFDRIKSAEKLAEHWKTLLAYMEMRGLFQKIETVQRLDLGDETPSDDGKTKPAKPGPKFGGQVAKLAESAGASPPAGE
jgi:hypothetical protein